MGFEPTELAHNGFQDRPVRPLRHPSRSRLQAIDPSTRVGNQRPRPGSGARSEGGRKYRRRREDLGAVVGDDDRVLELRGAQTVARHRGPTVGPHALALRTHRDHRLDRERHPRLQLHRRGALLVVRNRQPAVELPTDRVTAEARAPHRTRVIRRAPGSPGRSPTPARPASPLRCRGRAIPWSTRISSVERASISPTANVALVSPCTPPRKIVTSTFTISPSRSARSSGMPWQITSLTDVHTDFS